MSWVSFTCPRCHSLIATRELEFRKIWWSLQTTNITNRKLNNYWNEDYLNQELFRCTNKKCTTLIIKEYDPHDDNNAKYYPSNPKYFDFSQYSNIEKISPNFIKLYNDSWHIEQLWYKEIAGPWYRKAIEFLIKDFVIYSEANKEETKDENNDKFKETIGKMNLQQCINKHIKDDQLKEMASRAYWIGNDQTHYYKKRENKDIDNLKDMIEITMHFIEKWLRFQSYMKDMP